MGDRRVSQGPDQLPLSRPWEEGVRSDWRQKAAPGLPPYLGPLVLLGAD